MRNLDYPWQEAVQQAVVESDPNQVEPKVCLAEVVLFERIDKFVAADKGEDAALFQALLTLRFLREIAGRLYKKRASSSQ